MLITHRPDTIIIDHDKDYWPKDETVSWTVQAYSFLIPLNKTVTEKELADLIEKYYDTADPHNAAAVKCLREYQPDN